MNSYLLVGTREEPADIERLVEAAIRTGYAVKRERCGHSEKVFLVLRSYHNESARKFLRCEVAQHLARLCQPI